MNLATRNTTVEARSGSTSAATVSGVWSAHSDAYPFASWRIFSIHTKSRAVGTAARSLTPASASGCDGDRRRKDLVMCLANQGVALARFDQTVPKLPFQCAKYAWSELNAAKC